MILDLLAPKVNRQAQRKLGPRDVLPSVIRVAKDGALDRLRVVFEWWKMREAPFARRGIVPWIEHEGDAQVCRHGNSVLGERQGLRVCLPFLDGASRWSSTRTPVLTPQIERFGQDLAAGCEGQARAYWRRELGLRAQHGRAGRIDQEYPGSLPFQLALRLYGLPVLNKQHRPANPKEKTHESADGG